MAWASVAGVPAPAASAPCSAQCAARYAAQRAARHAATPLYDPSVPARLSFPRSRRLTQALDFQRAFAARMRSVHLGGTVIVFGRPNCLQHARLGLSVGRVVGGAVARNRVKRLIREAFRLEQHALPAGLDFVVSVRGPLRPPADSLDVLRAELLAAAAHIDAIRRRRDREAAP